MCSITNTAHAIPPPRRSLSSPPPRPRRCHRIAGSFFRNARLHVSPETKKTVWSLCSVLTDLERKGACNQRGEIFVCFHATARQPSEVGREIFWDALYDITINFFC
jgi:hypothetical protein